MASSSSSAAAPVARWQGCFRATTMANHKASAPPVPPQEQTSNEMQIVALDPSRAYQLLENGMPCMVHLLPEFQKDAVSYYVSHHKDLDVDLHLVGAFHPFSEHWSGMLLFNLVNGRRNIKTMEVNLLCVEDESTEIGSHLLQYSAQQCGAKSIQASVHGAAMEAWWQQLYYYRDINWKPQRRGQKERTALTKAALENPPHSSDADATIASCSHEV